MDNGHGQWASMDYIWVDIMTHSLVHCEHQLKSMRVTAIMRGSICEYLLEGDRGGQRFSGGSRDQICCRQPTRSLGSLSWTAVNCSAWSLNALRRWGGEEQTSTFNENSIETDSDTRCVRLPPSPLPCHLPYGKLFFFLKHARGFQYKIAKAQGFSVFNFPLSEIVKW